MADYHMAVHEIEKSVQKDRERFQNLIRDTDDTDSDTDNTDGDSDTDGR